MNEGQDPSLNQGQQGLQGSEWPPLPQMQQIQGEETSLSVAQQLGFPEEVYIKRTSGEMESGWRITGINNLRNSVTGQKEDFIQVDSVNGNGEPIRKHITFDQMNEWNPRPLSDDLDDDTIPRSELPGYKDEQAKNEPEAQVDQPELNAVPEEVAEEVGEVAVAESDLVQEPSLVSPNQSEPESSSSEPEQVSRNNYGAMQELAELWGMPENMTSEQALKHLEAESQKLEQMTRLLSSFDGTRHTSAKAILDTLQDRGIVYLGNNTKAAVDDFLLDHRNSSVISGFDVANKNTLLPVRLRKDIEHFQADFKRLQRTWADATEGFRNGRPALNDPVPAQQTANLLNRSLPDLHMALLSASRQVKSKITELGGSVSEKLEASAEEVVFRKPEYAKFAKELEAGVSPERLEEITQEFEAAINLEVGMIDDPSSPRAWFGDRLMSNNHYKSRSRVDITGRNAAQVYPRRYSAELMVDMLSGKFDHSKTKGDEILLDSRQVGGIRLGQHRAAALAMLYGPKWPEIAPKLGYNIEREDSR